MGCRQILSLKSEVFCSLLLSSDVCEVGNQTEVPLEDCTLAEANIFLRYIYMRDPVTDEYQAEGLTKVTFTRMTLNLCHDMGQGCIKLVASVPARLTWLLPKG